MKRLLYPLSFLIVGLIILTFCGPKAQTPVTEARIGTHQSQSRIGEIPEGYFDLGTAFVYPYTETFESMPGFPVTKFLNGAIQMLADKSGALHTHPDGTTEFLEVGKTYSIPLASLNEQKQTMSVFVDKDGLWVDHEYDWIPKIISPEG